MGGCFETCLLEKGPKEQKIIRLVININYKNMRKNRKKLFTKLRHKKLNVLSRQLKAALYWLGIIDKETYKSRDPWTVKQHIRKVQFFASQDKKLGQREAFRKAIKSAAESKGIRITKSVFKTADEALKIEC